MTNDQFNPIWEDIKALWGAWGKSIDGPAEDVNFRVVFKMFRDLDTTAVGRAVEETFAEKGTKKNAGFEPPFPRILELAKFHHFAARNADPMRDIHRVYVSMLPRYVQLEREVEWHRRTGMDETVSQGERDRHADIAALGSAKIAKANAFESQEHMDKSAAMEAAQVERARRWRQEQIDALRGRTADDGVREHVRAIPPALSRPSGERKRQSQTLGQVWK